MRWLLIVLCVLGCDQAQRQKSPSTALPAPADAAQAFASSTAASRTGKGESASAAEAAPALRALQMNLCNSGRASCYEDGRAIPEAIALISARRADVVTLNEICQDDVEDRLWPAFAEFWSDDWTFYAFQPARDYLTGDYSTCVNGALYGVGLLGRMPRARRESFTAFGARFPIQDEQVEDRVWLCAHSKGDYSACTTHLSATRDAVALAQCKHLLSAVVPAIVGSPRGAAVYVAGDLNLEADSGAAQDARNCVPQDYTRTDDGDVQHAMASQRARFTQTATLPMTYTDHDALFNVLAIEDAEP
jgi:endonuclease/exonuclease/phosphatase family metal-dependent hydrolase